MSSESFDVVIIGAGLSGVGAAVHLQREHPGRTFTLLEMRSAMGGTWDLFRYPGIRSDSSMYTLGYEFKPWTNPKSIADGPDIKAYIEEAAREHGIEDRIRYQHQVVGLEWSGQDARWTLTVRKTDTGETTTLHSRFLLCCAGYYRYDRGHTPEFAGRDDFAGPIIHPQFWPEDLDYDGKRIVVIGSGATAVTLVPALAERAAHVTMLQRSPGYLASVPQKDPLWTRLRGTVPDEVIYSLIRARSMTVGMGFYNFARAFPDRARRFLLKQVEKEVGSVVDMKDFTPRYDVWDERLCAVPDGDMFEALREGRASVVTGKIDRITERGVLLESGEELEADILVTATGLEVQMLGGTELVVDGEAVNVAEKLYYKGAMLQDVPNFAMVFGYTNSSWTLKADLIAKYVCRVLRHMDEHGYAVCTPRSAGDVGPTEPFLNLTSGYIRRAHPIMPRQGAEEPWKMYQNYLRDYVMLKLRKVDDEVLVFSRGAGPAHDRRAGAASGPGGARLSDLS